MAILLMVSSFAGCQKEQKYEQTPDVESTNNEESTTESNVLPENVNSLTGKADLSDGAIGGRPIAIIVENSPAARPQWGLTTPDIVVEGVVEGGITRMMWIYADAEKIPDKVGPVRSARHDYVEIAKGMNAIFVHWGGSDENGYTLAYPTIKNLGVNNIDGLTYSGSCFYRDTTRNTSSEHRGCTGGAKIQSAIAKLGYSTKQTVENWQPYDVIAGSENAAQGNSNATGVCSQITLTFSNGYIHTFKYNEAEKKYYNYLNNKVMTDGNNGKSMAVENVIALYVPVSTLKTKKGHQEWNFEATNGTGVYVSNGVKQEVSWSKSGKSGALKIYSADGKELVVNNGQTWMGIIPAANKNLTKIS